MAHVWQPISDYESSEALEFKELRALSMVWADQKDGIAESSAYRDFEARLKREWAVETGLIEGLYALRETQHQQLIEHGLREGLLPYGSVSNPVSAITMMWDHHAALELVYTVAEEGRPLSTGLVKEMHALLTRHQKYADGLDQFGRRVKVPLERGAYKKRPNNPLRRDGILHQYCPPEQVASEMDRLVALHHAHVGVVPEVEAAWLHHRFVQIHPFQDGNGRVARWLATLVYVQAGWLPLVVRNAERTEYFGALEQADGGSLKPLVDYFGKLQRRVLLRALSVA